MLVSVAVLAIDALAVASGAEGSRWHLRTGVGF
jgi:hypothetical protein